MKYLQYQKLVSRGAINQIEPRSNVVTNRAINISSYTPGYIRNDGEPYAESTQSRSPRLDIHSSG